MGKAKKKNGKKKDKNGQNANQLFNFLPDSYLERTSRPIYAVVFLLPFILFYWLHFLVAHENESIGRKIQAQTEELARIERANMALRQQVATTYAEAVMAERAQALGYRPQQPLYLLVDRPLAPASAGSHSDRLFQPSIFRDAPVIESTAETGTNTVPGSGAESSSAVAGQP